LVRASRRELVGRALRRPGPGHELVEPRDALKSPAGDRCITVLGDVEELAPQMCPAEGERDRLAATRIGDVLVGQRIRRIARSRGNLRAASRHGQHHDLERSCTRRRVDRSRSKAGRHGRSPRSVPSWCVRGQDPAPAPPSRRLEVMQKLSSSRCGGRSRNVDRVQPRPIHPVNERRELRCRQSHHPHR
jgi:hypothetical protein